MFFFLLIYDFIIVSVYLESCWTPLDELHVLLPFYHSDRRVYVFRYHVAPVQQAHCHVLPHARIAVHHLVIRLEARARYLRDRYQLMTGLLRREDRCVCGLYIMSLQLIDMRVNT